MKVSPHLVWLLARGYLVASKSEQTVSLMVRICFVGILIGTCSLALVISVMKGFEQATHEQLQGIHAHIVMRPRGGEVADVPAVSEVLEKQFGHLVAAHSPSSVAQVIIQKPGSADISNVIALRGIDPHREAQTTSLEKKIVSSATAEKSVAATVHNQRVLLGAQCAQALEVRVGDPISLMFVQSQKTHKQHLQLASTDAFVGGIFKTGIEEFDQSLALCSLPFFETIFPDAGVTQINIRLHPNQNEKKVIDELKKTFDFDVYSWQDMYPALVQALVLEKYAMFLILLLIVLVACMSIVSLIFMLVIQKRGDIAILAAMGMPAHAIHLVFLLVGTLLTSLSALAGLSIAWLVGMGIERYQLITLPDVYYVSHLPIQLHFWTFATIFLLVNCMGVVASLLPMRNIRTINIGNVLRFET